VSRDSQSAAAPEKKAPQFKAKYKLHGMIASVAVMWLAYAVIHHGLTTNNSAVVSAGMAVLIVTVGVAYYFG
jgi:hypothetical protein